MARHSKGEEDEIQRLLSGHFAAREEFAVEYKRICSTKSKVESIYFRIWTEIELTISEGNADRFKELTSYVDFIFDVEDQATLKDYYDNAKKSFNGSNVIILACKHNQVKILDFILSSDCNILCNLSIGASRPAVLPSDEDESCHNAFYYAIRSGNVELVDTLITKWPGNYFAANVEALDEVLSKAYEELKVNNVPLTEEVKLFVESKLLNLRFFSNVSEQLENSNSTMSTITERIDLVLGNIDLLKSEYSGSKIVDDKFLFVAKFIAQNIHILKQQLKATYDILPWEEIEFCLVSFVSARVKQQEINFFYNATLDKNKIINYLDICATELKNLKDAIKNDEAGKFSELPKLEREKVVTKILRHCPQFKQLYRDYQQIRDIHSLEKISNCVKLAESADPKQKEGQLLITRVLQILGEHFKNTLESPMLSRTANEVLLHSLPKNTGQIIMDLRNSQSHIDSYIKRTEIVQNADANFFESVRNDIKDIDTVISDILYKNKIKIIKLLLNKIVNSESLAEIKEIAAIVTNFELDEFVTSYALEYDKLGNIVENFSKETPDLTIFQHDLFGKINSLVVAGVNTSQIARSGLVAGFCSLKGLDMLLNNNKIDDKFINGLKFVSKKALEHIPSLMEAQSLKQVAELIVQVANSARSRLKGDNLDTVNKCICEIIYIVEFETGDLKLIEELRDKLNGSLLPVYKPDMVNFTEEQYNNQLELNLSELKGILNNNDLTGNLIAKIDSYKKDKKLQAVVEMLVLDIMSILGRSDKHLENNLLFLDDNSLLLTGKCLRDYLAYDYTLLDILLSDPSITVVLNAEKLITEDVITSKRKMGKPVKDDHLELRDKFDQSLLAIANQEILFTALKEGNHEELKKCLEKGADINGRNFKLWTSLHFAAQGRSTEIIKFLLEQKLDVNAKDINGQTPLHVASTYGNVDVVEFLIKETATDVDVLDTNLRTPLHIAAQNGHKDTVEILLKNYADTQVQDSHNSSPFHLAVRSNHIDVAKFLLENGTNVNEAACGLTPLHIAAESDFVELVNYLLENGANVLATNDNNEMPLHAAALKGNAEVVTALISKGAHVNAGGIFSYTPLHCASENGHKDVVDILLKHKANVNAMCNTIHTTPLHFASRYGHEEIVQTLLKYGANAKLPTEAGFTALYYAVSNSHVKVVTALLKHGVDVNANNKINSTALHMSARTGHKLITKLLLKYGANPNVDATNNNNVGPLHVAAMKGYKDIVDLLIQHKADITAVGIHGGTPLHAAAISGIVEIAENLIKNKAKVDAKSENDLTPLHLAALNGNLDIVKFLIKNNADVNATDKFGCTVLHAAVTGGYKDVVLFLLQNGAKINMDNASCRALHAAAVEGRTELAEILIANGANVNSKSDNTTPLLDAIQFHRIEIVELLIRHGANVENGKALVAAVLAGSKEILEVLLKNSANVNLILSNDNTPVGLCVEQSGAGNTLLHLAAEKGDKEVVKVLVENGAKVDAKNGDSITPLFVAAQNGHAEIVEVLLANRANVNLGCLEPSPLHTAAAHGQLSVVKVLLNNGAKLNLKNSAEKTALELAVGRGHLDVVKFLMRLKNVDVSSTILHKASIAGHLKVVEFLVGKGCDPSVKDALSTMPIHVAVIQGYKDIVEFFLSNGLHIDVPGIGNRTPLHYSAMTSHFEVAKFLIEQGADINAKDITGMTPLHIASEYGMTKVVEVLLNNGAIHNISSGINGKTPLQMAKNREAHKILLSTAKLFDAVKRNVPSDVEKFIKAGGSVNAKNSEGWTPLHSAASKGSDEIVKILLQNKANPNSVGKKGFVPLHYAAKSSHLKTVETLLTYGAKFNIASTSGKTPSQFSIGEEVTRLFEVINTSFKKVNEGIVDVVNDLNAILTLSQIKAVMCAKDNDNNTLIVAAIHSSFPAVEQLKEVWQGDIASLISKALELIVYGNYEKALSIFKSCYKRRCNVLGLDNPGTLDIEVHIAETLVKQGLYQDTFNMFEKILQKQKEILGVDNKDTLLTKSKTVILLHRLGKNKEAADLYEEVYEKMKDLLGPNHLETLRLRLNMASVLESLGNHEEALHVSKEVFEKLKETVGANDVATLGAQNNVASFLCSQRKYAESLKMYQDVFERRKNTLGIGNTETLNALHNIAVVYLNENKTHEATKSLQELLKIQKSVLPNCHQDLLTNQYNLANVFFEKGKNINSLNIFRDIFDKQKTALGHNHPMVLGISRKIEELTARLNSVGIDASETEYLQKNLSSAASNGDVKTIETILKGGADLNEKDAEGRTPLHFAISNGRLDIVNLLINNGADVTEATNKGNTPLHTAAFKANKDIVEILLKQASIDVLKDFIDAKTIVSGTAALHVAATNGSFDIVLSLLKHGANYEIKNNDGKTPLNLAKDERVLKLLKAIDRSFKAAKDDDLINDLEGSLTAMDGYEVCAIRSARNNEGITMREVCYARTSKNKRN